MENARILHEVNGRQLTKKAFFFFFFWKWTESQRENSEPVARNETPFSFQHLHIRERLQDLFPVPQLAYINASTSKISPFCFLVMANAEIKQCSWIRATTGDLNFTHHWSLCVFDSS